MDPKFAIAYALKALLYSISRMYDPIDEKDWLARCAELDEAVRTNADGALALNDSIGMPYFALALHEQLGWRGPQAHAFFEKALSLRPNDSNILGRFSVLKWSADEFEHAIRLGGKAVSLDPSNTWVGAFLGNDTRAFEALKIAHELMPEQAAPGISGHVAYGYRNVGRDEEARQLWARVEATMDDRFVDPALWIWGCRCKGDQAGALEALRKAVEQPQYRQEIFLRTFMKQNNWHDPVLEEPDFAELRSRLAMT